MNWPSALRSLRHRNVRLFAMGQSVSLVGTWMQSVAMGWLVYRLTGSAEMLGVITFLNQVPSFLLGAWSGTLADRLPRRKLVFCTQTVALLQASALAALTFTGAVRAWHLVPLAVLLGLATALEMPSRHSLLADLAGEDTTNAVALNSTIINGAKVIGVHQRSDITGFLIRKLGVQDERCQ